MRRGGAICKLVCHCEGVQRPWQSPDAMLQWHHNDRALLLMQGFNLCNTIVYFLGDLNVSLFEDFNDHRNGVEIAFPYAIFQMVLKDALQYFCRLSA